DLPFPDKTFDAVTSAYLVRNVTDPGRAFEEQVRVTKPGGMVVCLDTSPPPRNMLTPLLLFHLGVVIPFLGSLIARNRAAYTYLPTSTRAFMTPEKVASLMRGAGLEHVSFRTFMLGTQVVHKGRKRARSTS
ncbi:MAG: class I SAM-dependent methyltransferase, partial [Deltaproteobacteria bacterium]|nr:class I SAM-dependent methyltransferase [Deltaproteobacteria bacterium]